MKIMKKLVLIFFALAVFAPISIRAQSTAANKAWAPFLTKFKAALNSKSTVRVKALMASEREFFPGGGDSSRNEWLQMVVKEHLWDDLLRDLNRGVKFYNWEGKPGRVTVPERQGSLLFAFVNGKWAFMGIMGD